MINKGNILKFISDLQSLINLTDEQGWVSFENWFQILNMVVNKSHWLTRLGNIWQLISDFELGR